MLIYMVAVAGSNAREQKNGNHLELEFKGMPRRMQGLLIIL